MREPQLRPRSISSLLMCAACAVCLAVFCVACSAPESAPVATNAPPSKPSAEILQQADASYAAREDLARLREGLETLRRIRAVNPNDYEATWRAARINYTLGDTTKDQKEKESAFRDGIEAGELAVKSEPGRVEGHFWLGACQGGYAQAKGPIYGLAAADTLRREMETVLKLDEGFQAGSAFMVLGRLDVELPAMFGGDNKRAVETLERGLKYGEQNSLYRLRLAEAYVKVKRMDDARAQLNYLFNLKPLPEYLPEHKEAVAKGRALLADKF